MSPYRAAKSVIEIFLLYIGKGLIWLLKNVNYGIKHISTKSGKYHLVLCHVRDKKVWPSVFWFTIFGKMTKMKKKMYFGIPEVPTDMTKQKQAEE